MASLFENILTASFHGSIVIAAVLVLRLVLRKAPKKYICWLWLLAGLRLLMPFQVQSELSLQPATPKLPQMSTALVLLLWVAVALGFVVYSLVSYVTLWKKVRFAVKIPGGYETENIETAFILGFIKPKIYIPMGMDETARKHILAHERTHLDKGDHWIKMIGFLALALHWFNPLVWAAYILLCKDIEMACDERVVQFMELPERKEYSAALLDCSTNHGPYMASPVAFGEISVKSRILSILNYRKPSFWAGLLSVAAVGFVTLCLVTSPAKAPEVVVVAPTELTRETEIAPPPAEPLSDWGFPMVAEATSSTTMNLYSGVDVDGIPWDGTPMEKKQDYWIEQWKGESWQALHMRVQEPGFTGSTGIEFSKDNVHRFYVQDELDWTMLYGPLGAGYYRIGVQVERLGQTKVHYAQFRIWKKALTGEEDEAVVRCKNALQRLLDKESWSVTLGQTNRFGKNLPVRTVYKANNQGRVDSFIGKYCYNTFYCEESDLAITGWAEDFRLDENKEISFPEGQSLISQEEVRFVATWEDVDGVRYQELNTYTFAPDGSLTGAGRTKTREGGEETQKVMLVGKANWGDTVSTVQTPKDSTEATADSPWGLFFRVDDDYLSPSGGEVWFSAGEHVGVIPYTTDGTYWLECKAGDKWQKLPCDAEPRWADTTCRLRTQTTVQWVDWSEYYGELESGLYRMGKRFYDGEDSIIQYAEFYIQPQGGIHGAGGEEAIARINAALARVKAGNYKITETTTGGFRAPEEINTVYWKYDGVCVVDYYDYQRADGYRHSGLTDDPEDDLFYHMWCWAADWDSPNQNVYFAEGASKISPEEIAFSSAFAGSGNMQSLRHYRIFFDEKGDVTRMEYSPSGSLYSEDDRKTTFYFEDVPEEEIAAWVAHIQQQQ